VAAVPEAVAAVTSRRTSARAMPPRPGGGIDVVAAASGFGTYATTDLPYEQAVAARDGELGVNLRGAHLTMQFVLTHYARAPVEMQGGTTFHFVTGHIGHTWQ